jgi:mycothiol synthase
MVWPGHLRQKRFDQGVPEGYRLRQYVEADQAGYSALMEKAGFGVWDAERVKKTHEATLSQGMFVVENVGSQAIVATTLALHNPQALHPHGGELGWVAADPGHRGKGLGRATCGAVMNLFLSRGYERVYLMTDDFRLPAIALYLKLGFEPLLHTAEMAARWEAVRRRLEAFKRG